MRFTLLIGYICLIVCVIASNDISGRTLTRERVVFSPLVGDALQESLASRNARLVRSLENMPGFHLVLPLHSHAFSRANPLDAWSASHTEHPVVLRTADPLYHNQWHLSNTGQNGAAIGEDARVSTAWNLFPSIRGQGIRLAICDDGVEYSHPDLIGRVDLSSSYNYVENNADPMPSEYDFHGTSCAGVAAATAGNHVCGSGAAPETELIALRLLGYIPAPLQDWREAQALATGSMLASQSQSQSQSQGSGASVSHASGVVDISSNSWGPYDSGSERVGPGELTLYALHMGVSTGRGDVSAAAESPMLSPRGIVYTWAGGNGRGNGDHCNLDGYANSPYTLSVSALGPNGRAAYYAERCTMHVISAPSSGCVDAQCQQTLGITTTDRSGTNGYDRSSCTSDFGGTSSAAPLVAGIVALILQKAPLLTWRDVMNLLIRSARLPALSPWALDRWQVNGANLSYSPWYGFGVIDAAAALQQLETTTPNGVLLPSWRVLTRTLTLPIEGEGSETASLGWQRPHHRSLQWSFMPSSSLLGTESTFIVEQVEVQINCDYPNALDLQVSLTSPDGTTSHLMAPVNYRNNNLFYLRVEEGKEGKEGERIEVALVTNEGAMDLDSWGKHFLSPSVYPQLTPGQPVLHFYQVGEAIESVAASLEAKDIPLLLWVDPFPTPLPLPSMAYSSRMLILRLPYALGLRLLATASSPLGGGFTLFREVREDRPRKQLPPLQHWPLRSLLHWGETIGGGEGLAEKDLPWLLSVELRQQSQVTGHCESNATLTFYGHCPEGANNPSCEARTHCPPGQGGNPCRLCAPDTYRSLGTISQHCLPCPGAPRGALSCPSDWENPLPSTPSSSSTLQVSSSSSSSSSVPSFAWS